MTGGARDGLVRAKERKFCFGVIEGFGFAPAVNVVTLVAGVA
jgi:hypothetical protein